MSSIARRPSRRPTRGHVGSKSERTRRRVSARIVAENSGRRPAAYAAPTIAPALAPATQSMGIPAAVSSARTPTSAIDAAPPALSATPIFNLGATLILHPGIRDQTVDGVFGLAGERQRYRRLR